MQSAEATIRFGSFELSPGAYRLLRDGKEVPMEPQVFEVLAYLADNRDGVVLKTDLLDAVWGDRFVSESALTSRIKSARHAVGDDGRRQTVIRTVHGRGYQFIAEVEVEVEANAGIEIEAGIGAEAGVEVSGSSEVAGAASVMPVRQRSDALIGRDDDLDDVWSLARRHQIVTIVGPGGVGKTRLATEIARMWESAGDRSIFVALETLTDPDRLAAEIVQALGIVSDADVDHVSALTSALRDESAPLVVLDNFEHLADAAPQVAAIAAELPELRVLVTSRERLRLSAEYTFELRPLSLDRLDGTSAASSLFEHAARRVQPGFRRDDGNAESIASICRLVDGLPLAIELAAAQLRYVPVDYLVHHLRSNLVGIEEELADRPSRQRSVMHLMEWSYAQLTPSQQGLLTRLSVFSGGCSIAGARAVGGVDTDADALSGLQALIDKSLMRPETRARAPRFTMLNLIRHFAAAKLGDGEARNQVERAHTAFIVDAVRQIDEQRWGHRADQWRADVADEYHNIELVLERSAASGDAESLGRIVGDLNMWWYRMGRHRDGRRWTREAMAVLDRLDASGRGRVRFGAGYMAMADGHLDEAKTHFRAAIDAADEAADWRYAQYARASLSGTELTEPDRFESALARVDAVIAEARERGETAVLAHALNVSGVLLRHNGRPEPAMQRLLDAAATNRENGDRFQQTMNLGNLGLLMTAEQRWSDALSYYQDALQVAWRIGSHLMSAFLVAEIARTNQLMGALEVSTRLLGTADAVLTGLGARLGPTALPAVHDETVAALEAGIGPARFEEYTELGRQATLEAAVELALASTEQPES